MLNASIYNLLEGRIDDPAERVRSRYTIIEHITGKEADKKVVKEEIMEAYERQDKDLRILSYKILLEKFNSKYGVLGVKQKGLLREYINNITDTNKLKGYVQKEITAVRKSINISIKKINDVVVKIKLKEVSDQLGRIGKTKNIKDDHVLTLMRSYELIKEIKNVIK